MSKCDEEDRIVTQALRAKVVELILPPHTSICIQNHGSPFFKSYRLAQFDGGEVLGTVGIGWRQLGNVFAAAAAAAAISCSKGIGAASICLGHDDCNPTQQKDDSTEHFSHYS